MNHKSDKLGKILFTCILLSLIPIFFASTIFPDLTSGMKYQVLVGVLFSIQSVFILYYFFTSKRKTVDIKCLLFAFIFTISQLITILISSLTMNINYLEIINILARFTSVFIFLCIPSKVYITKDEFRRFMLLIVILGLAASLYNMVINYKGILNILNINNPYAVNFTSFYLNRNSFAQLLFFSIIANSFLWSEKQTKFNLFCYLIYFINIFSTLSRTVLACVFIFFMVLLFIYFRKSIKANIIIFVFITGLILLINFNTEINNFIINMIIRKEYGTSGRSNLWSIAIDILNKTNWIFGIGYISSMDIIKNMGYSLKEFHSFYIETLVGGGIIDLLLHFIIFIFALKRVMIIFKNDKKIGIIYFSAYISFLFYALVESASFFSMGYVGTLFTIFIITIPLLYSNSFMDNVVQ